MATGIEMLDALKGKLEELPAGSTLLINRSDKVDLCLLTAIDLESRGVDRHIAERVASDLMRGSLDELGKMLDIRFTVKTDAKNLIFGEGLRRANKILENDPQTLEEMLLEMDQIRHPERYAS